MNEFDAVLNRDAVTELSDYGLIKAEGEDAMEFLHNQFTNDLKQVVTETQSQLSAYCSPKGRILSLFRIFKANDAYYLAMPRELVEATHKRLGMFVLMSKVKLEDVSGQITQVGVSGPNIDQKLMAMVGELPEEIDDVASHGNITIIRIPGPFPRYQLFGPPEEMAQAYTRLSTFMAEVSPNAWELLDIEAGIPVIHQANVEAFVPQMVNLQAIGGLNFKKGCYPGQEIVARMQYLGKLKRRMYRVHSSGEPAAPGDNVYLHDGEARKAGTVVMAQPHPEGGSELLIVAEIEAAENSTLHQLEDTDSPLKFEEMPYSF
jgi:folate-binding protein YgfZ